MAKTRHMQARLSQRGIRNELVDIVLQFGIQNGDKIILNRKAVEELEEALFSLRSYLHELKRKSGLVVVSSSATEITSYRLNSYRRKRRVG